MTYRIPHGDGVRDRRARSFSGPNIRESERHSKRVRISGLAHLIATKMAGDRGTVGGVIEDLLVTFAAEDAERARLDDADETGGHLIADAEEDPPVAEEAPPVKNIAEASARGRIRIREQLAAGSKQ